MKQITIRDSKISFSVSGTEEEIKNYIDWVKKYNKGTFKKKENAIICSKPVNLTACRLKAQHQNLAVDVPNNIN